MSADRTLHLVRSPFLQQPVLPQHPTNHTAAAWSMLHLALWNALTLCTSLSHCPACAHPPAAACKHAAPGLTHLKLPQSCTSCAHSPAAALEHAPSHPSGQPLAPACSMLHLPLPHSQHLMCASLCLVHLGSMTQFRQLRWLLPALCQGLKALAFAASSAKRHQSSTVYALLTPVQQGYHRHLALQRKAR